MSTERHYDLHLVRVVVRSEDATCGDEIHRRMRHFAVSPNGHADVEIEVRAGDDALAPPEGASRVILESPVGDVVYFERDDALWYAGTNGVEVRCDAGSGSIRALLRPTPDQPYWLLTRPMLTVPLVEALKRRGLYGVHAALVSVDGRGLLLPGTSGSGKSTLALALARAGFGFVGDDMLLLDADGTARSFAADVDATDETVARFPEIDTQPRAGWAKRQVCPREQFGAELVAACTPAAIVFPAISGEEETKLTPLAPAEALFELAPNVLLTEPESSQAHLDALSDLVRRCPSYRLRTGRDLDRVPECGAGC